MPAFRARHCTGTSVRLPRRGCCARSHRSGRAAGRWGWCRWRAGPGTGAGAWPRGRGPALVPALPSVPITTSSPARPGVPPPVPCPSGGPSRLAGVKENPAPPAPGGGPGPARLRGSRVRAGRSRARRRGRARRSPSRTTSWPGWRRPRRPGHGPARGRPGRARPARRAGPPGPAAVPSGTVSVTRPANPTAAPPPAQRRGEGPRRPSARRPPCPGAGPGVLAEEQIQVGAHAARPCRLPARPSSAPLPRADPLVGGEHLIGGSSRPIRRRCRSLPSTAPPGPSSPRSPAAAALCPARPP